MKKQIVFLMTDTTRKDMVGCYGNPKMKTPNLDRLAEEGIRYENAIYLPASLWTGKKCNFLQEHFRIVMAW